MSDIMRDIIHGVSELLRELLDSTSVSSLRRARILWNSLRHLGRLLNVAGALFQIVPVSCDRTIITGLTPR